MHEELDDVHLLASELVPDGGAGGVAVGPGAAVNQVDGTAFGGGLVVPAVVVETAVPAVKCPGKRSSFDLDIDPVTRPDTRGRHQLAHRPYMTQAADSGLKLHGLI